MKYLSLVLICLLGVLSCTRLDIAVSWADTFIASQVDDYFSTTSAQSKELKASLRKTISQLRKEQFAQWATHLRDFEKQLQADNLTEESFHQFFDKSLADTRKVHPYFTDTAVAFISTATPGQLEHFERTLREKNVDHKKKIQDSKKHSHEARHKYLRWTDMWLGSLSKEQEELLNQHLSNDPFPALEQIKNKEYVLNKFSEARKSPESLKVFVSGYYNDKYQFSDPEYLRSLQNYQTGLKKFLFQLLTSLNEKQKKHLRENLIDKASILEKLAAKD